MPEAKKVNERALVLGGGGVAGIAWMTGLLLGLEDEGVHLRDADILIGTSAGSTVAAQIAGTADLNDLFLRQVDAARQVTELSPEPQLLEQLSHTLPELFKLTDPVERAQRMGELADTTKTVHEAVRRTVIAERLPSHEWPSRPLKVVAVDIKTGEPRIFDRLSGVELVDAVAASCAVPGIWPPVSIGVHRYMDGGGRSSDNADLATGYQLVFVISPMGMGGISMPGTLDLAGQVETLKKCGSAVYVIEPNDAARKAMGNNPLSPECRGPAAQAGREQGRAQAAAIQVALAEYS
jgi:NTE family protein